MANDQMNKAIDEASREIDHELRKFGAALKEGLTDPEHMLSIDEIEKALKAVQATTNQLYSEMTGRMLDNVEEGMLIKLKKENTDPKG